MDEKALQQDETQIFLFDFSARELYEEFEGMVHSYLHETIKTMKESLDEFDPNHNIPIRTIEDFYRRDCRSGLKEFEEAVKEMFYVPDNVELPLPEMVKEDVTDEELEKEEYDIEQLEDQLRQARIYQAALEQKKAFVTKYIEPTLKVVDACLEARERVKYAEVQSNYINKFIKASREGDTVEKVYDGSSQAEKLDFFSDLINT